MGRTGRGLKNGMGGMLLFCGYLGGCSPVLSSTGGEVPASLSVEAQLQTYDIVVDGQMFQHHAFEHNGNRITYTRIKAAFRTSQERVVVLEGFTYACAFFYGILAIENDGSETAAVTHDCGVRYDFFRNGDNILASQTGAADPYRFTYQLGQISGRVLQSMMTADQAREFATARSAAPSYGSPATPPAAMDANAGKPRTVEQALTVPPPPEQGLSAQDALERGRTLEQAADDINPDHELATDNDPNPASRAARFDSLLRRQLELQAEAASFYQVGARAGLAEAQYRFANLYDRAVGDSPPQGLRVTSFEWQALKLERKLPWLRAASAQNYPAAQSALGKIYWSCKWYQSEKLGIKPLGTINPDDCAREALRLWTLAAQAGDRDAQQALGFHYTRGGEASQPPDRFALGVQWFERAAEQGSASAQLELLRLYSAPGPRGDVGKALKWATKLAASGDSEAKARLPDLQRRAEAEAEQREAAEQQRRLADEHDRALKLLQAPP